jgi:hypothetical protein
VANPSRSSTSSSSSSSRILVATSL